MPRLGFLSFGIFNSIPMKKIPIHGTIDSYAMRLALDVRLLFVGVILLIAAIGNSISQRQADPFEQDETLLATFPDAFHIELRAPEGEHPRTPSDNPRINTATTSNSIVPSGLRTAPDNVRAFIGRWIVVAVQEQKEFGIPASSILAQGAKESRWGESELTVNYNSYFGVKCHNKSHRKDGKAGRHCANYHDNHAHDRFMRFATAWESWRAHSRFLMGDRYAGCLKKKTAGAYCDCIAGAGYAYPDAKGYARDLRQIIDKYGLAHFDTISERTAQSIKEKLLYGK